MTIMYRTLDDFRAAKRRARQERDMHKEAIEGSWAVLQDPDTRGILLRDAVGDALRNWGPYRKVSDLLHGRISGSTVYAVGMALASAQRGMMKRVMFSGITMLLSKLIEKNASEDENEGRGLFSTVAEAIGSFAKGMHERKAAREGAEAQRPPVDVA